MGELTSEIIKSSIGLVFGLIQFGTIALFAAGFKMYWDLRELKKDTDAAFKKIRDLEDEIY